MGAIFYSVHGVPRKDDRPATSAPTATRPWNPTPSVPLRGILAGVALQTRYRAERSNCVRCPRNCAKPSPGQRSGGAVSIKKVLNGRDLLLGSRRPLEGRPTRDVSAAGDATVEPDPERPGAWHVGGRGVEIR